MSKTPLVVAIVGAGMIGSVHRRAALAAGAIVRGVCASSPERSAAAAAAWQLQPHYDSYLDVVADPRVDVVHICSPNSHHQQVALAAIAAGKHVICEKPLATSVEAAQQMAAAAQAAGVVATVPFVYRYHPVVREAKARLGSGELGAIRLIHGSYLQDWLLDPEATNWRVDPLQGGHSRAFADIGSHWCDLLEWLSGERFDEVLAELQTVIQHRPAEASQTFSASRPSGAGLLPVQTEDVALAMLRTRSGVLCNLTVSQLSAGRKNRLWFEVDAEHGSLAFDQESPEQLWLGGDDGHHIFVRSPGHGSSEQRRLATLPAGHAQGYAQCFEAFVADTYAAVRGEAPHGLPTFEDGLRSAQLVAAVLQSSHQRRWLPIQA